MNKKELADHLHNSKYNCAQAVLLAFADEIGEDKEALFRISEGFGFGAGCGEGICGALSGAIMLAGLEQRRQPGIAGNQSVHLQDCQRNEREIRGEDRWSNLQGSERSERWGSAMFLPGLHRICRRGRGRRPGSVIKKRLGGPLRLARK